jgi:hypothetical protein
VSEKAAKSGSGLLSVLKSLVVEEVEVPDKVPAPKPAPVGAAFAGLAGPPGTPVGPSFAGAVGQQRPTYEPIPVVDPEAKRGLEARMSAQMPQAYKSFMEQHEALKDVVTDDAQRFQAALKTSHTTVEQLLQAIDSLEGILQAASQTFADDNRDRKAKATAEAQKNLDSTDALIASNEAQLQTLQQTITTLREKRSAAAQDVQNEVAHLEQVRLGFAGAVAALTGQLDTQRRTIATTRKV